MRKSCRWKTTLEQILRRKKNSFNPDLILLLSKFQILEDLLCAVSTIYSQSEEAGNNKGN